MSSSRKKIHLLTIIEYEIDLLKFEFKPLLHIGFDAYPNPSRIKTLSRKNFVLVYMLNPTWTYGIRATLFLHLILHPCANLYIGFVHL